MPCLDTKRADSNNNLGRIQLARCYVIFVCGSHFAIISSDCSTTLLNTSPQNLSQHFSTFERCCNPSFHQSPVAIFLWGSSNTSMQDFHDTLLRHPFQPPINAQSPPPNSNSSTSAATATATATTTTTRKQKARTTCNKGTSDTNTRKVPYWEFPEAHRQPSPDMHHSHGSFPRPNPKNPLQISKCIPENAHRLLSTHSSPQSPL